MHSVRLEAILKQFETSSFLNIVTAVDSYFLRTFNKKKYIYKSNKNILLNTLLN